MDNAVLQNMRQRRSCRAYQDRQISLEEMETVIEAGALSLIHICRSRSA